MSVTLPTYPGPKAASLLASDAGGWQMATLGGADIRLDRLGDRFGLAVVMPPMKWHTIDGVSAARVWSSRLNRGIAEEVIMEVPQPDFVTSAFAVEATLSAAAAQSVTVAMVGLGAAIVHPEGMMVTIKQTATGRHFLHQLRSTATSDGGGGGSFSLWPRTRIAIVNGDKILVRTPVIEGKVVSPVPADMEQIRTVGIAFDIMETR